MKEQVEQLKKEIKEKLSSTTNLKEANELKVIYLGKKGPISDLSSKLKELSVEEKKTFGMLLNGLKQDVTNMFDEKIKAYEAEELNKKLESEKIDISLPGISIPVGAMRFFSSLSAWPYISMVWLRSPFLRG